MLSNQSIIQRELTGARGFLIFWYFRGPIWFWNRCWQTILNFEAIFAVRSMFQHLGEPIFQDYTRAGRILGFFIRLLRIAAGIFFYLATICLFSILAFIWLLLPPFAIVQIFRSIFNL